MTIVGGAVAPVIMGDIADTTGSMAIAFLIPLVFYGVIGGYAAMPRNSSTDVERDWKSDEFWEMLLYPMMSLF